VNINGAMKILTTNIAISSRCSAKNVGDFPKNVGVFLENVGDFFKNVGSFRTNLGG